MRIVIGLETSLRMNREITGEHFDESVTFKLSMII